MGNTRPLDVNRTFMSSLDEPAVRFSEAWPICAALTNDKFGDEEPNSGVVIIEDSTGGSFVLEPQESPPEECVYVPPPTAPLHHTTTMSDAGGFGGVWANSLPGVRRSGIAVTNVGFNYFLTALNESTVQLQAVKLNVRYNDRILFTDSLPYDIRCYNLREYLEDRANCIDINGVSVYSEVQQSFVSQLANFSLWHNGKLFRDYPYILGEVSRGDVLELVARPIGLGGGGKKKKALMTKKEGKEVVKEVKNVVRAVVRGAGRAGGAYVGNAIGQPKMGAQVGDAIAKRISRVIGMGDYQTNVDDVRVNSLIKGGRGAGGGNFPSFATSHDSVRIRHREYLLDILTPAVCGGFTIQALTVNAGSAVTFPYLYAIAQRFEQYRFHGLIFEFVPTTSPYNSAGAMGNNIFSCDYNSTNLPFSSKVEMENSNNSISARFDKGLLYGVECATQAQNWYYVRNDTDASTPVNLTDLCDFYYAMQTASTFPANSVVGELWVTYDVELCKPFYNQSSDGYARYTIAVAPPGGGSVVTAPLSVVGPTVNVTGALSSPVGRGSLILTANRETTLNLFTPYLAYSSPYGTGASAVNLFNLRVGDVVRIEITQSFTFPTGASVPATPIYVFTNLSSTANAPNDNVWVSPTPYTYAGLSNTTPVYLLQSGFLNVIAGSSSGGQTPGLLIAVYYVTVRKNTPGNRPIVYFVPSTVPGLIVNNYACNMVVQVAGRQGQDF